MKKLVVLFILGISFFSFVSTSYAKETLLDNHLDLKTNRLSQSQDTTNKVQSFDAEDQLFDSEMIEKVNYAKKIEKQQRQKEQEQLFLKEVPKEKEYDYEQLFVNNDENNYVVAKSEEAEAASTVFSKAQLLSLVLGLLLITIVTLALYYSRKRGQQNVS